MDRLKLLYYRMGAWMCRRGLLLLLAGLFFAGCKTVKKTSETTTVITDTVFKDRTVTIRDTIIKTEPAKTTVAMPSGDFKGDLKPIQKQFKNANLNIHKKNDTIYIECECDTIAIKARIRDVYEKEYRARSNLTTVSKFEKQELTRLQKFMISCGCLFWIVAIIGTIYLISKKK